MRSPARARPSLSSRAGRRSSAASPRTWLNRFGATSDPRRFPRSDCRRGPLWGSLWVTAHPRAPASLLEIFLNNILQTSFYSARIKILAFWVVVALADVTPSHRNPKDLKPDVVAEVVINIPHLPSTGIKFSPDPWIPDPYTKPAARYPYTWISP